MNIDLLGPYSKPIRQQHLGRAIINKYLRLTCMTIIYPATGWFEIVEAPWLYLTEVARVNNEYREKLSSSVRHLFDKTFLWRYSRLCKVLFDNGSKFKREYTPLLKEFTITIICISIKNPQSNAQVEQIHQGIYIMIFTKYLDIKCYDYIDSWG